MTGAGSNGETVRGGPVFQIDWERRPGACKPAMMRRAGAVIAVNLWLAPGALAAAAQFNILIAVADDWSYGHAGAYGAKWVRTPAFDRVAQEGLLFHHAYTPVAKCAPSRAALLTGRYPWQLEAAANHLCLFPPKFKTFMEALAEQGWFVGFTGKGWGPGVALDAAGAPRAMTGQPFNQRKAPRLGIGLSDIDYAANFSQFLQAAPPGKPWCFWYGGLEPHRPYEFGSGMRKGGKRLSDVDRVPAYWPDTETVRQDLLDYAWEVEQFDQHLGRMLAELEQRGQLDRTLVIVTSDNGMPFPRVKGYAYRDSNRMPLAVRWPAGIRQPGRVIEDFVSFVDLAPTVLELAGLTARSCGLMPMSGRSWRPLFEGRAPGQVGPARDHALVGKERTDVGRPHDWGYPIRGIVTRDWLYLRNYEPGRWPAGNPETGYLDTDGSPTKTVILERGRHDRADPFWQLNFGLRPAEELYDLRSDPECVRNRAQQPDLAGVKRRLQRRMERELRAQGDPRVLGQGHVFDEYPVTSSRQSPDPLRGFYERFMRGEQPRAGWVNPTDFEPEPIRLPGIGN